MKQPPNDGRETPEPTTSELVARLGARKRVPIAVRRARSLKGWRTRKRMERQRAAGKPPSEPEAT